MTPVRKLIAALTLSAALIAVSAAPAAAEVPAGLPCAYFQPHGILDRLLVAYLDHETADVGVFFCVARHANTTIHHRYWVVHWKRTNQWTWHPA
jgi:hypothetical protein